MFISDFAWYKQARPHLQLKSQPSLTTLKHSPMALIGKDELKRIIFKQIDKMTADKMTVDKMTANKMTAERMTLERMTVEIMTVKE